MKLSKLFSFGLLLLLPLVVNTSHAMGGDKVGGGGDASEERVDEIRADILSWIKNGGAKGLHLPEGITYEDYVSRMTNILRPKKVIVIFVEQDHPYDEELQVTVAGKPKTCRGFISILDNKPHIVCQISRFASTTESAQYRLIHHEYAGLAGIEKNEDAASDYILSSQLTDFLAPQMVLKLSVKKSSTHSSSKFSFGSYQTCGTLHPWRSTYSCWNGHFEQECSEFNGYRLLIEPGKSAFFNVSNPHFEKLNDIYNSGRTKVCISYNNDGAIIKIKVK